MLVVWGISVILSMLLLILLRADKLFSHWCTIQGKHHENWFSFAKIIYTCTNVTATFLVFDANINNFCSTTWCYGQRLLANDDAL